MVNLILAACDGQEGNPGNYRDYQLKRVRPPVPGSTPRGSSEVVLKG
jgi:hypothetical protein